MGTLKKFTNTYFFQVKKYFKEKNRCMLHMPTNAIWRSNTDTFLVITARSVFAYNVLQCVLFCTEHFLAALHLCLNK